MSVQRERMEAREPWLLESNVEPEDHGGSLAETRASPEDQAGFLSRYTFWWVFPNIRTANRNSKLSKEDMPPMPKFDDPAAMFECCVSLWRKQSGVGARVLRNFCWSAQRRLFLSSLLHGWLFLFCMTVDPLLLHRLLAASDPDNHGDDVTLSMKLGMVGILSVSMLIRVTCMELCYHFSVRVQNNTRSALVHAVFRKAMAVPDHDLDIGRLTNLMATDADKLGKCQAFVWCLATWTWSFMSLPVVVYFVYTLVGPAALVCVGTLVVTSLVSRRISRFVRSRTKAVQECRDRRSKMMNEMLTGIRTVKLQVWEPIWHKRLTEAREEEMRQIVHVQILGAFNSLVGNVLSMLVPVSIFTWYTLVEGKRLDATTAFTTMAWINTLAWSVQNLPGIFNLVADLKPTVDRIDAFITCPISTSFDSPVNGGSDSPTAALSNGDHEKDAWRDEAWLGTSSGVTVGGDASLQSFATPSQTAIDVEGASFGYLKRCEDGFSKSVVLEQINLQIPCGSFVMIAGPVGSGKSTLLASLAKARPALSGTCEVRGQRAYVSQKPFLLNATVRDNILFGLPMDTNRYKEAITLAALTEDLKALSAGDDTLVGENGVQLSGGQKARVALARAFYADADVILLDDVLSAVDAHTGKYLWDKCLVGSFLQRRKTVVLVSHQIQYLSRPEVSSVILLRDGRIWLQGQWNELAKEGDDLLGFVQEWKADESDSEEDGAEQNGKTVSELPALQDINSVSISECQAALAQSLRTVRGRYIDDRMILMLQQSLSGETEALESMREGTISWPDFKVYLGAFGSKFTVSLLVLVMIASAITGILSNVWLARWTSRPNSSEQEQQSALVVYISIGLGDAVLTCIGACVLTCCALAASRLIHTQMLQKVLSAPLSFFDASPTGRVLNRFLQDMQNIDSYVPNVISDQVTRSLNIITQLSLVYVEAPWVLCSLPIMVIPYWMIFKRMRIPNRDSRRIESVAHSPVYAHFSDSLHGRETIRAFSAEHRFVAHNLEHVNVMATACYGNNAINKWAQALTTQWGCMLYLACGLACVLLTHTGHMTTGEMGLVLLYSAQLQRAMMDYMMGAANVENKFVSVERVAEYVRLESEEPEMMAEMSQSIVNWPAAGDLVLCNVQMRYRLSRPLVLRGLDLAIAPNSKAAICGRTGCGKSSLFGALSRLYPTSQGEIIIGGRDIGTVPLSALRASVRVVSQDAFLLSGTVRHNLAMGNESIEDTVLWHILEAVGMAEKIKSLPLKLAAQVEASGSNFSVGERQLLTLARALTPIKECRSIADWRPPPVMLCDEATASVDLVTDEQVHTVVLSLEATVLMICHRLQHITRFDKVVVMDAGRVVEEGAPADLMTRTPASRLACLCAEAGVAS